MLYRSWKKKHVSSVTCCYCLKSHAKNKCILIRAGDKRAKQFYECFGADFKRQCLNKIYAYIGVHHLYMLDRWKLKKHGVLNEKAIRVALDHCYASPFDDDDLPSDIENEEELATVKNMINNKAKKMKSSSYQEKEIEINYLVCALQPLIPMATFCYNCKNSANYKTRSEGLVMILDMKCECGKNWTWYSSEHIKFRQRDKISKLNK